MRKHKELEDMVLEAIEEHKEMKALLNEMDGLVNDSEKFESKLTALMENVEHHAEGRSPECWSSGWVSGSTACASTPFHI